MTYIFYKVNLGQKGGILLIIIPRVISFHAVVVLLFFIQIDSGHAEDGQ